LDENKSIVECLGCLHYVPLKSSSIRAVYFSSTTDRALEAPSFFNAVKHHISVLAISTWTCFIWLHVCSLPHPKVVCSKPRLALLYLLSKVQPLHLRCASPRKLPIGSNRQSPSLFSTDVPLASLRDCTRTDGPRSGELTQSCILEY
jgi:hypothetical protein